MRDWNSEKTRTQLERLANKFLRDNKRRGHKKPRQEYQSNSLKNKGLDTGNSDVSQGQGKD
jgi:hypothetical protein